MKILICPKCKGKGYTRDSVVTNPLIIICTLDVSLACTDQCNLCNGKGTIKVSE